jgi:general stress protein 26
VAVYGKSAKVRNLRRDPRCTVLNVAQDWRSWVSVEGEVQLFQNFSI